MATVSIMGMGLGLSDLGTRHLDIIAKADLLVGGERHLALFPDHPAEKKAITPPIEDLITDIRRFMNERKVVVLASGDPLFYGIGKTLAEKLGDDQVEILPNTSVMAEAFARIKRPWADAVVISLHGRDAEKDLAAALSRKNPIFLFTDHRRTPAHIARIVLEMAPGRWQIGVFECLGEPDENISWKPAADAMDCSFKEPNAVILWPDMAAFDPFPLRLGAPDEIYQHERGLITKSEVRAVAIAKLRLGPDHVLWDLGAGSGSVAIEAAIFLTRGRSVAVEKHPGRAGHIRENIKRFNVPQVSVQELTLPQGMAALPEPDRVFMGGGGKDFEAVLESACGRLRAGGRIVVNLVVIETAAKCMRMLQELGFIIELVQIQVGKGAQMPMGTRISGTNPVFIISADKPEI